VTDDKKSGHGTHTKKEESVFLSGMFRIVNEQGMLVSEDGLPLFERYAMFTPVDGVLALVPYES
jgi:hypothetical protein